jgi:beta-1,4-mannosyl-glycoprotein beta-1,4-N-acetylglucosaminyltransferase
MKTFDCFLFYNELDLLEIRLNLLYDHIDYFVIVESEVTFQGQLKDFNFEKNIKRFEKFIDKIFYYKIEKYKFDFIQLPKIKNPQSEEEKLLNRVFEFVEQSNEFDKTHYWWGNESYQRESIWRALSNLNPGDDDLILLSDADELINPDALIHIKKNIKFGSVFSCKQHEFYYYLNYYHHSNWFGQIAFLFGSFKYTSLNKLRSLRTTSNIEYDLVILENAGWHFTSLGTIKNITEKIKSWGHKEFNNRIVLSSLNYNIKHGYDIFRRNNFGKLSFIKKEDELLEPISKFISTLPKALIGPEIQNENIFKKFLFSLYFKLANRIYNLTTQ